MYIIAEMACSHEGDPNLAKVIIDGAGKAGANAIQFQIWKVELNAAPSLPNYDVLQQLEMSYEDWKLLFEYSKSRYPDMDIIACISELESLRFCEELGVDAYKIHNSDLAHPTFIQAVAKTGKRIDLAVGASTKEEITDAIAWIQKESDCSIWLMYGYQNFPTRSDDVHLTHMLQLGEEFNLPVGYQDHSDGNSHAGFWLPAAAIALGIAIQEKHITHDRSKKGIDHEAALNPDEFEKFVVMAKEVQAALGEKDWKPFSEDQEKYREYSRKSIVAAKDLAKGTVLSEEDMHTMRASPTGLPPKDIPELIGGVLKCDLKRYDLVTHNNLG